MPYLAMQDGGHGLEAEGARLGSTFRAGSVLHHRPNRSVQRVPSRQCHRQQTGIDEQERVPWHGEFLTLTGFREHGANLTDATSPQWRQKPVPMKIDGTRSMGAIGAHSSQVAWPEPMWPNVIREQKNPLVRYLEEILAGFVFKTTVLPPELERSMLSHLSCCRSVRP